MIDVIDLAQRLIRTPSPVIEGNELAVAGLISDTMTEAGLPAPRVAALQADRPNLVSTIDYGEGGRHLVLCGHIDTKPVGEAEWTVDPYAADIVDDRLYGLGSGDMKAAVAAMIVAVEQVAATGLSAGRITLLFTADEEAGAQFGAKHIAGTVRLDADAMVIGEPSGIRDDYDSLPVASRGLGRFVLTAYANQGHSSLSSLLGFRNAGADLAAALTHLGTAVQLTEPENAEDLQNWHATVNPALTFSGGWGYGVLPEWMSATIEVRTLPGMVDSEVLAELAAAIEPWNAATGADVRVDYDNFPNHWIDGSRASTSDEIARSVRRVAPNALGRSLLPSVFPGTTDASWFTAAEPGLPCLPALGPGLISRAHGADEWVSVSAVRQTADLYRELALDFCSARSSSEAVIA